MASVHGIITLVNGNAPFMMRTVIAACINIAIYQSNTPEMTDELSRKGIMHCHFLQFMQETTGNGHSSQLFQLGHAGGSALP